MTKLLFKSKLTTILLCAFISVKAQKQDRIWLFSDSAGIDFNDISNPLAISSSISDPCLASFTSIADNQGQLLFYSAGVDLTFYSQRVYDRFGNLMENGDSLRGYPWVSQGSMILPIPGDSMKYYLFTGNRTGSMGNNMYYNIIDMSYNGGLGKVTSKNNLLLTDYVNEKMNATKHANGRDWWLMLMSTNTDQLFHKFLITPQGIQGPFDQMIGSGDNRNKAFGQMIFSKDGSKVVAASSNSSIDVFDFDRCTGDLYNYRAAGEAVYTPPNRYFGCSISPNGNVLYTSSVEYDYKNVYQFDLTASNINSTKQTIISYPDTGMLKFISFGQHLLGPDDRIYLTKGDNFQGPFSDTYFTHHMDVIINPNDIGFSCDYRQSYFDLGNGRTIVCLPTMVNYNLGSITGSVCDSLSSGVREMEIGAVQVFPNPFSKQITVHTAYSLDAVLKVYNSFGEIIYSNKVTETSTVDLSFLSSGNYLVEIVAEKFVVRKKMVKME